LLIACINFINLTTARSVESAKEVGIRKVVGALKGELATQFIGESVVLCLIAFVLPFIIGLLLPLFNQLSGKIISRRVFSQILHTYSVRHICCYWLFGRDISGYGAFFI
jgi:putative ABC transport system permease protein